VQRWVCVVVTYGLGTALVTRDTTAAGAAIVVLAFALALTWRLGLLGACRCRSDRREYLRVAWARSLWILHLPWLVAPLFIVAALFVGLIELWAGDRDGEVYFAVVVAGWVLWLLGCLTAFIAWWRSRARTVGSVGYRLGRADAVAFFLGLAVLIGAAVLGFAAGVLSAVGVSEWLGIGGAVL